MSKKYYVVWKGRETGVFDSWSQVKRLIDGQRDAQYMGFTSQVAAQSAFKESYTRALMQRSLQKKDAATPSSPPRVSRASTPASSLLKRCDINIYTDGACSPNPGQAGTGLAIYHGEQLNALYYGLYDANGTNNSAELLGILEAFKLADTYIKQQQSVEIFSDSKYAIDCITKWAAGWQKKGWKRGNNEIIKNLEIIQQCFKFYVQLKPSLQITHVKGHANIEGNELADRMAVYGRMTKTAPLCAYLDDLNIAKILAMPSG